MLTLDKVQLLEERIKKAVALIHKLREENSALREELDMLKLHNDELKDFAKSLGNDTQLIEETISTALSELDEIGDPIPKAARSIEPSLPDYEEADTFMMAEGSHRSDIQLPEDDPIDDLMIELDPDDEIPIF